MEFDLKREFSPDAEIPELFPITVEIKDDEEGVATYIFEEDDVARNNDDDNENQIDDLLDLYGPNVGEDDLLAYPIQDFVSGGMSPDPDHGYFALSYDLSKIRVWDSMEKNALIMPRFDYGDYWDWDDSNYWNDWDLDSSDFDDVEKALYEGQSTIWIEGVSKGDTLLSLQYVREGDYVGPDVLYGGEVDVTVWSVDYDIDSDNNNGFNFPDNSEWEEYIENHTHAIGKLLYTDASHYTPTRIRLNAGLNPNDPTIKVRLDFDAVGDSGIVALWNTHKADANRVDEEIDTAGNLDGNRILQGVEYSLAELNYNPATGGITVFVEATSVFDGHDTKKGVDDNGKPTDSIKAVVVLPNLPELSDEVQYMVVRPDTFYPHLIRIDNKGEQIRNMFASDAVYGSGPNGTPFDAPKFGLQILDETKLRNLGVDVDTRLKLMPNSSPGFKPAVYRDLSSGMFVLAFAGTDDVPDILTDALQGTGRFSLSYQYAIEIARSLNLTPRLQNSVISTGHSLGGGLASAAAVGAGLKADTFNAAGLRRETLLGRDENNDVIEPEQDRYPGALNRYDNVAGNLIDAYYLDWDMLSNMQDTVPGLQSAIGERHEMDGPLDGEMAFALAYAGTQIASGIGILSAITGMGAVGYVMIEAHTRPFVFYGVLVDEATQWDIYGYEI